MAEHTTRRTRAQYTSRACDECRRRKVKCNGASPCQCCVAAQVACRFAQESQRGRRRLVAPRAHDQESSRNSNDENMGIMSDTTGRVNTSDSVMMQRVSMLEEELSRVREGAATLASLWKDSQQTLQRSDQPLPISPVSHPGSREPPDTVRFTSNSTAEPPSPIVVVDDDWFGQGEALLPTQKRVFQMLSAESSPDGIDLPNTGSPGSIQINDSNIATASNPIVCSLSNTPRLTSLVRFFLTEQNLCFHCLDPDPFVARLSHLLETHSRADSQLYIPSDEPDLISLAALACIVLAQAELVSMETSSQDQETSSNAHHSWRVEGHRLLNIYQKGSRVNMDVVSFYLVETFFCVGRDCQNQEYADGAHRAIAMTVTSAYSMGLHNEAKWVKQTEDEKMSRRCLWASIYFMDRQVSYKAGRPYLIQENEVAVNDLTSDIARLSIAATRPTTMDGGRVGGEPTRRPAGQCSSTTSTHTSSSASLLSVPTLCKLQYLQALIEIGHVFTRAWKSFFSLRVPNQHEKEEATSLDALFQRVERNLPADLVWNTPQFLTAQKTARMEGLSRLRLILFARISILRLAVYHASLRGRRGDPPLLERCGPAEYQHIVKVCDDISCTTLTALFAYLDRYKPGSCLTTYATSAAVECIYHPIAIARLYPSDTVPSTCQLSGRMIASIAHAVQTFQNAVQNNPKSKTQLVEIVLPLIEGILSQQKHASQLVTPAKAIPATNSFALPSLKDQLCGGLSESSSQISNEISSQFSIPAGNLAVDMDAAYCFDPSSLPDPFADGNRPFDFANDLFQMDMTWS